MVQSAIAAHILGISAPLFPRYVVTVPAGGSATLVIPVPQTYVMIFTGPVRVIASDHDQAITGTLMVAGVNVLVNNFPFTADADETSPKYGVVRNNIQSNASQWDSAASNDDAGRPDCARQAAGV